MSSTANRTKKTRRHKVTKATEPPVVEMSPTRKSETGKVARISENDVHQSNKGSVAATGNEGETKAPKDESKAPEGTTNDNSLGTSQDTVTGPRNAPTRQAKLPVYSKKKPEMILSPKAMPTDRSQTRAVCTIGLRCGANLLWMEENGKPAYVWPILQHCKNDPNAARVNWKIDYAGVKRDPKDPSRIYEFLTNKRDGSGTVRRKLQNLFIRFPEGDKETGPEFRKKWGELMVQVYNSPAIQHELFGPNTLAYYAGDLTPKGEDAEAPYLSDFLTLKNTIDALEIAYGKDRTRDDIVNDNLLLGYYFPKKLVQELRDSENSRRPSHAYMAIQELPTFDNL